MIMKIYCFILVLSFALPTLNMERMPEEHTKRKLELEFLYVCRKYGNLKWVKEYIGIGINPNATDFFGRTALHYACAFPNWDEEGFQILEYLLTIPHIDVTKQESLQGNTPLHAFMQNYDFGKNRSDEALELKKKKYETLVKDMITKAPSLVAIPNHFNRIPLDYCTTTPYLEPSADTLIPLLLPKERLNPTILRPLLLDVALARNQTLLVSELKKISDKKIITAVICAARERRGRIACGELSILNGYAKIGKILNRFLTVWDLFKHKVPVELAHMIAYHDANNKPFTNKERESLILLFEEITKQSKIQE